MRLFYLLINSLVINLIIMAANYANQHRYRLDYSWKTLLINILGLFWYLLIHQEIYLYCFGLTMIFLSLEDLDSQTAHTKVLLAFLPIIMINLRISDLLLISVLTLLIYKQQLGIGDFLPIMILNSFFNQQQFSILICLTALLVIIAALKTKTKRVALLPFLSVALFILVTFNQLLQPVFATLTGTFEF